VDLAKFLVERVYEKEKKRGKQSRMADSLKNLRVAVYTLDCDFDSQSSPVARRTARLVFVLLGKVRRMNCGNLHRFSFRVYKRLSFEVLRSLNCS